MDEEGVGVDEFARRCNTTVRMVREYQTLGVLPPPLKVGRVARYGGEHFSRWRAVSRLQERGYSLAAISDLFQAWETGSSLPSVLGISGDVVGALDETPVLVGVSELEREVPDLFGKPSLVRRAIKAGLVEREGDDRYVVRSPALVQLVADAMGVGVSPTRAISIVEAIHTHTAEIATAIVEVLDASITSYDELEYGDVVRRGRPLLAQAVASIVVHQVGARLIEAAKDRPDVARLVDGVRVGVIRVS
jgi:DNA-binding transcriptional MerR regulator